MKREDAINQHEKEVNIFGLCELFYIVSQVCCIFASFIFDMKWWQVWFPTLVMFGCWALCLMFILFFMIWSVRHET